MAHEYHHELSDYAFRSNLARGRGNARYFTFDDCDYAIRALHDAAVSLARENGVDVADGLTPLGWSTPSADDLRQNIAATRRVMDALRFARVDYESALKGRFSLSGFLLDAGTWHCQILEAEKIVACRWNPNFVGAN